MRSDENRGEVVPFREAKQDMGFPPLAEVRAYWEALRAGRRVPLRSDIDPRGIEGALDHAFILERIAPQVARFRLAGTHLGDLMGMEVRGMPLTTLFTPLARTAAGAIVEGVFRRPEVAELILAGETGPGRPALVARMILLPLRSDLGDISRALGCLCALGQTGRAPRRFDLTGVTAAPIGDGPGTGDGPATGDGRPAPPGLAEAPATFAPAASPGRAHLRLVRTGD
ncbi:MAG: PAS domain-containing protein [Proteobacteria bacterium]|nr:PAS domain-containing protein [Pseudomonadota bacterium]